MAGDPLKHVRAGEQFDPPAEAWNAFADAAVAHRSRAHDLGQDATPSAARASIILVKNDSGGDVDRWGILGVESVLITPTESELGFQNDLALVGDTPTTADHTGKFVILAEPIPDGKIGRAFAAGVCPVVIGVTDEGHEYAEVANGQSAYLASGGSGVAQILWKQSGTGFKWAVVRLGAGGGEGMPDGTADQQILVWNHSTQQWDLRDKAATYKVLQVTSGGTVDYDWVRAHG